MSAVLTLLLVAFFYAGIDTTISLTHFGDCKFFFLSFSLKLYIDFWFAHCALPLFLFFQVLSCSYMYIFKANM